MPKFRLRSEHYIGERLLPAGTVVEIPETMLSIEMEGTDDESQGMVDAHVAKAFGEVGDHGSGGGINPRSLPNHPIMQKQADGTFGDPVVIQEAHAYRAEQDKKSRDEIPQTTRPDVPRAKPNDGKKPVFPNKGD